MSHCVTVSPHFCHDHEVEKQNLSEIWQIDLAFGSAAGMFYILFHGRGRIDDRQKFFILYLYFIVLL